MRAAGGVEREFHPGTRYGLPAMARNRRRGARALRSSLERLMLDVMFDVPGSDITGIKISRQVVRGESKPCLKRKNDKAAA